MNNQQNTFYKSQEIPGTKDTVTDADIKKDVNQVYSDEDKSFLDFLQTRLRNADDQKLQVRPEFKYLNYYQYFNSNEKIANTLNKDNFDAKNGEVNVQTGTVEGKFDAVVSNITQMNLGVDVEAYDAANLKDVNTGTMMTDTIEMINEKMLEKENQELRNAELLKQGTNFIDVTWERRMKTKSFLKEKYNGEFKKFAGVTQKLEVAFEGPMRKLLYSPHVFLGDMTIFDMELQPFIFTYEKVSYEEARSRFSNFDNWEYVKKTKAQFNAVTSDEKTIYSNNWTLQSIRDNEVEIIIYQDKWNDRYNIIVNGVLLLPTMYPLSAVNYDKGYSIVKNVRRVINHKFAYGSSFVSSGDLFTVSKIMDEFLRLMVLKTRKSFSTPYANITGQVIPKAVLSPGNISNFNPQGLIPIGKEGQGVTQSEFNVYKELENRIDRSTVSSVFTGQEQKAGKTATESKLTQDSSMRALGSMVASIIYQEQKVHQKFVSLLISKWFQPMDKDVLAWKSLRKVVGSSKKNLFRITTRDDVIQGEGVGQRQIIPVEDSEMPTAQQIRDMENEEKEKTGIPVKKIFVNSSKVSNWMWSFFITVRPKDRNSTAKRRQEFRGMAIEAGIIMQMGGRPNLDTYETMFANLYGKTRDQLWVDPQPVEEGLEGQAEGEGGQSPAALQQMLANEGKGGVNSESDLLAGA